MISKIYMRQFTVVKCYLKLFNVIKSGHADSIFCENLLKPIDVDYHFFKDVVFNTNMDETTIESL